jgi:hypothetical protein
VYTNIQNIDSGLTLKIEEHKKLKKEGQKLFVPNQHLNKVFRISISNPTDKRQTIEVHDQIPFSKHEKISVTLEKMTTPGYKLDETQGLMYWDLTLEPSPKKEIELYYKIQIPEEWK